MTSQAYQKGETACGAQQRDDRAYARITKAAERSAAATIGNNRRPYHGTRENCQPRYALKYLHLVPHGRAQLALRSDAHLRHGDSWRKYGGTLSVGDRGRIALARVGSHTRQLASLKLGRIAPASKWNQCATSSLHSRPPPVGDT
jgi:hypothetical protein